VVAIAEGRDRQIQVRHRAVLARLENLQQLLEDHKERR
jgi:hypothetical protein